MKIAIPVWDSRVSPVFDTATRVLIVSVEKGKEVSRIQEPLKDENIYRRVNWLAQKKIDVLVCGAISRPLAELIISAGIEIVPWMVGNVEEIRNAYMEGKLPNKRFLMPGCFHSPRRFRRRMGPFGSGRGFRHGQS